MSGDGGCCFSCKGLGWGGPASGPETNGRCADCLGQGCAHEGPCDPEDVDRCPVCNAPEVLVERFEDQVGFEEQARPVVVTVLGCGHEIVTPGRWKTA